MSAELLLGDEAVAQAAIDAGISGAFSYPGTPSTEIFEYILRKKAMDLPELAARWAANEKVAYEEALGCSYAGHRALVSMKHVGLNVAADPFVNSALTGTNGGLVLAVADDPSMHSSQNEQDSRFYADFAKVPAFEPGNQQQAYDMTREAFAYSEQIGLPVMLRLTTRLAHSRANVTSTEPLESADLGRGYPSDPNAWTLVPANARRRFAHLLSLQPQLRKDSEESPYNELHLASDRGVIVAGLGYNYVREVLGGSHDRTVLRIGRYPLPTARIRQLVAHCREIVVIEEGYPFIEQHLLGLMGVAGKSIKGRLSGDLREFGELTPDTVGKALGVEHPVAAVPTAEDLAARPPQLCRGCPHADSFKALVEATSHYEQPLLFGDIGCYTLGVMPPFRAVHSCVDMGASIAMAHGAAQTGAHPVVCTLGDSTFAHSGMTPLLGAAQSGANLTVFILDNAAVAMTGAQQTMLAGDHLVNVVNALGVDEEHVHVLDPIPRNHAHNVAIIRREIEHPGLSVIIPTRPCVQLPKERKSRLANNNA